MLGGHRSGRPGAAGGRRRVFGIQRLQLLEHLDVSGLSGRELEERARASWAQADAAAAKAAEADADSRAQQAQADAQTSHGEHSSASQEIGEVIAPLAIAGTAAATATAVWDSPEARAAWADGLIANGAKPGPRRGLRPCTARARPQGHRPLEGCRHRGAPAPEGRDSRAHTETAHVASIRSARSGSVEVVTHAG